MSSPSPEWSQSPGETRNTPGHETTPSSQVSDLPSSSQLAHKAHKISPPPQMDFTLPFLPRQVGSPFLNTIIGALLASRPWSLPAGSAAKSIIHNLAHNNMDGGTSLALRLSDVEMPELSISTYRDLADACDAIGEPFMAAGETGGVSVIQDVCQHIAKNSSEIRGAIAQAQACGIDVRNVYVPGGSLPDWANTIPQILMSEPRSTSWISHPLEGLGGLLRNHPIQLTVFALSAAAILQLRRWNGKEDQPPSYEGVNEGLEVHQSRRDKKRKARENESDSDESGHHKRQRTQLEIFTDVPAGSSTPAIAKQPPRRSRRVANRTHEMK